MIPASGPSMDSRASIIRDNARLSAENSNLGRRTCGEKNWWQKSAAFEIVFVVARSRRGWNFNNYSVDFPSVPLGSFAKKKRKRPRLRFIFVSDDSCEGNSLCEVKTCSARINRD